MARIISTYQGKHVGFIHGELKSYHGAWKAIGKHLGFSAARLDEIFEDHPIARDAFKELLLEWTNADQERTLEELSDALKEAGQAEAAKIVDEMEMPQAHHLL